MRHLVRIELYKLFRLRTTWVALGLVFVVACIAGWSVEIGARFTAAGQAAAEAEAPSGHFVFLRGLRGGEWVALFVLLVAAAGSCPGEAELGTWRLLLIRPVTRGRVIWSKAVALGLYGLVLILAAVLGAGLVAGLGFGFGDVTYLGFKKVYITGGRMLGYDALALAATLLPFLALGALAFCIGLFSERTSTAVGVAIGVVLGFEVGGVFFPGAQPFLPTTHRSRGLEVVGEWAQAITTVRWDLPTALGGQALSLVCILVALLIARWRFQRMSILS